MMLPVVDLHRLRVDMRLECREVVWQWGKYVTCFCRSRALLFYLCHREHPCEVWMSNPALRDTVPSISWLRGRAVLFFFGGAGGRVSAALAALSGRHYVDRPTVLLQFRAGAVHGGGGSRGQKYRDAETPA